MTEGSGKAGGIPRELILAVAPPMLTALAFAALALALLGYGRVFVWGALGLVAAGLGLSIVIRLHRRAKRQVISVRHPGLRAGIHADAISAADKWIPDQVRDDDKK